jgi:serpin B
MSIFLPREDKTTADVLAALKDGNGQWQLRTGEMEVDLKMPRFETETNQPLPEIMSALGMPSAFDPCCADFSGFCDLETYISSMRQVAKIKLDEEGTEAAAVTIIEVGESAVLEPQFKEFHANRPFLYIIFEQSTGVIFFIGQYAGVEGARTPDGISDAPRLNDKGQMKNDKCGVYDLQGRQITNAQLSKGLYIKDGRKVIVP